MTYISKKNPITTTIRRHENPAGYTTTVPDIIKWFGHFNTYVFKKQLADFRMIEIKTVPEDWAACEYEKEPTSGERFCYLQMNPTYRTFNHFIWILGHECIHNWQWTELQEEPNHAKSFWKWKTKFDHLEIQFAVESS